MIQFTLPTPRALFLRFKDAAEHIFTSHFQASKTRLPPYPKGQMGHVTLVGAGPGSSDYLTLGGLKAIQQADVILYDALVEGSILDFARADARLMPAGKRCGNHLMPQDMINQHLIKHAKLGARVVRLKGGDPFIFGRGAEEVDALEAEGLSVSVMPGISTAMAAAAELKRPLTRRGINQRLVIATGTCKSEQETQALSWAQEASSNSTLALYMARNRLQSIAKQMIDAGKAADTPCVLVENVGRSDRREQLSTLGTMAQHYDSDAFTGPTIVLIGASLARAHDMAESVQSSTKLLETTD